MKHIALTSTTYRPAVGGIESSIQQIARALALAGAETTIVCGDHVPGARDRLAARESIDKVPVHRYRNFGRWINYVGLAPLAATLPAYRLFGDLGRTRRFDGIVARQPSVGLAAKAACPNAPLAYIVPSVASQLHRPDLVSYDSGSLKQAAFRLMSRFLLTPQNMWMQVRLLRKAEVVVVFSSNMRNQLLELSPDISDRIARLSPGVDLERFAPRNSKEALRRREGLPVRGAVGIAVGRLIPAKGFDLAIEAFARLPSSNAAHLVLVGGGAELSSLKDLARKHGVSDRVHFMGERVDPEGLYASADFYVMSSRYEGFGHTVLEGLASGLPVIAFRSSEADGVRTASEEILGTGSHGILCEHGPDGLANGIRRYLALSDSAKSELSRTARHHATRRFSWNRFTGSLLELIENAREHLGSAQHGTEWRR